MPRAMSSTTNGGGGRSSPCWATPVNLATHRSARACCGCEHLLGSLGPCPARPPNTCADLRNAAYWRSGTAPCRALRPTIRFAIPEIRFTRQAAGVPRSLKSQGSWDLRTSPTRAGRARFAARIALTTAFWHFEASRTPPGGGLRRVLALTGCSRCLVAVAGRAGSRSLGFQPVMRLVPRWAGASLLGAVGAGRTIGTL